MNFINISFIIFLSVLVVLTQSYTQLKNTSGHEIIDGNCTNATYDDRVYYDHVDKYGFPLIVRSETVEYYGDREIYCIQALNQKSNATGGTANITDGGVGHRYVVIELVSFRGDGLEFYVSIYANNKTKVSNGSLNPLMIGELLKVEYYGDPEIYCILALNQKDNATGGTANLIRGGVGHRYAIVELESYKGYGLEFYVSIYAKNGTYAIAKSESVQPKTIQRSLTIN